MLDMHLHSTSDWRLGLGRSAFDWKYSWPSGGPLTYGETVEVARLLRVCSKKKVEVMLRIYRCHDFDGLRNCMREVKNPNKWKDRWNYFY
jgi:hypothetical protein